MRFAQLKTAAALVAVAIGMTTALATGRARTGSPDAAPGPRPLAALRPGPVPKAPPTAKELEASELKALKGEWRVVKLSADKERTEAELAVTRLVFASDGLAIRSRVEGWNEDYKVKLLLTGTPRGIDFTIKDDKGNYADKIVHGIYVLRDDALTLCTSNVRGENNRPTEFKPGEGLSLFVLERVKDEKEELKALAGEWKYTKISVNGKDVPADEVTKTVWSIKGDELLLTEGDGKAEKATLKLDPAAAPATIDFTIKEGKAVGNTLTGIYFRQGDKLTVCLADPKRKENAVSPTELKAGDGVVFLVFERAPKK